MQVIARSYTAAITIHYTMLDSCNPIKHLVSKFLERMNRQNNKRDHRMSGSIALNLLNQTIYKLHVICYDKYAIQLSAFSLDYQKFWRIGLITISNGWHVNPIYPVHNSANLVSPTILLNIIGGTIRPENIILIFFFTCVEFRLNTPKFNKSP